MYADIDTKNAEYVATQLKKVVNGTIVHVTVGDGGFPAIYVRTAKGDFWLDIQCDAEGNGPGWVNVERV